MVKAIIGLRYLFAKWNVDMEGLEIRFVFKKQTAAYQAKDSVRMDTPAYEIDPRPETYHQIRIGGIRLRFMWEETRVTTGEA